MEVRSVHRPAEEERGNEADCHAFRPACVSPYDRVDQRHIVRPILVEVNHLGDPVEVRLQLVQQRHEVRVGPPHVPLAGYREIPHCRDAALCSYETDSRPPGTPGGLPEHRQLSPGSLDLEGRLCPDLPPLDHCETSVVDHVDEGLLHI